MYYLYPIQGEVYYHLRIVCYLGGLDVHGWQAEEDGRL
jgi:hypothetical protein